METPENSEKTKDDNEALDPEGSSKANQLPISNSETQDKSSSSAIDNKNVNGRVAAPTATAQSKNPEGNGPNLLRDISDNIQKLFNQDTKKKPVWKVWHTIGIFAIVLAIVIIGLLPIILPSIPFFTSTFVLIDANTLKYIKVINTLLQSPDYRLGGWIVTILLLGLFIIVTGHGITGYWRGALIDSRNRLSLSRLQALMWTVLILSAFLFATLTNVNELLATDKNQPGNVTSNSITVISIPFTLWTLMGVSLSSTVLSPVIQNSKEDNKANLADNVKTSASLENKDIPVDKYSLQGQIVVANNQADSNWGDLFSGEEVGNAAQLDIGKIQLFYFTLILLLAYAAQIAVLLTTSKTISALPDIDSGELTLFVISHGAYITNKIVPHSQSS